MSFTQVYKFQDLNGYESVISEKNSDMVYMGFGRILLNPGQKISYTLTGEEHVVVLQHGDFNVTVEYKGETAFADKKGTRTNPFDELPTACYVPPQATITVSSEKGCECRVFTAWLEEGNDPHFLTPDMVVEGNPGEYIYKRKYRYLYGQAGNPNDKITKRLMVGESVGVPGGWIGFPAHRHDYDRPGKEVILDEIFSYQVRSAAPDAFGGVFCYAYDLDDNGKKIWDEVSVIEDNVSAVALPSGYHSTVSMAGSEVYLLWGLAGPGKINQVNFDGRYSWLEGCLY